MARELPLQCQCFFFNSLGMREDRGSFVGQYEACLGALKERLTNGAFKSPEPATHCRLALPQFACRGPKRSLPRDGEENSKIAPFHGP